jgi:hypothetical protein
MKTNVTYTFNLNSFIKNSVPSVEEKYVVDHINPTFLLPLGDYLNKTLYMSERDEQGKTNLTAFRILAWAVTHRWDVNDYHFGISFYIQKPDKSATWVDWGVLPMDAYKTYYKPTKKLFWSVNDYLRYVNGETVAEPINWTRVDCALDLESYNDRWYEVKRSYYWDGDDIKKKPSRLTYIMGDASGVFVGLKHQNSHYYNSKADCLKSRLDGIAIVDFDEEPHEIHIDVQPKGARVHTLRFVEE